MLSGSKRQNVTSALFQVMACHLFNAKLLPKPILSYCQFNPKDQTLLRILPISFIQENVSENAVCRKVAILFSPQCVWGLKSHKTSFIHTFFLNGKILLKFMSQLNEILWKLILRWISDKLATIKPLISNIRHPLVHNKIGDNSDVIGAA